MNKSDLSNYTKDELSEMITELINEMEENGNQHMKEWKKDPDKLEFYCYGGALLTRVNRIRAKVSLKNQEDMNKLDKDDLDKGYVFVPYVMESTSTSINNTTVWYKNRWKNLWLKIKFFFRKPKDLKEFEKYSKKPINSKFYQEIKNYKMNKLDKDYCNLLQDILDNGVKKQDRTGTGTLSVFGRQIRHKMSDGFPLLTTKKLHWKSIVTELLWFLRGDTNIKYLVENDVHIWDGDAYKNYERRWETEGKFLSPPVNKFTKEELINEIKTNPMVAKELGELGPVYGKQWRRWESYDFYIDNDFGDNRLGGGWSTVQIDQIANLIKDLKTNPDSRRLMVSAWNPADLPVTDYRTDDELYKDYLKDFEK